MRQKMRGNNSGGTGNRLRALWALFLMAALGGCARYHPVPITPEAVRARLSPPDMSELRIRAEQIDHPILRPVEFKPDDGLTPDCAAVIAVLLNPSLRALRDQRTLAKAQLLDAGLLPNPEISFGLDFPAGGDTAEGVTAYGLGLSWDAASLLTRSAKVDAARANKEAVDLDIAWQEWQVAQAAKAAAYQLLSLEHQIAPARDASRRLAQNLGRVREAVYGGSLTSVALNAAQAASRRADENLLDLQKQADRQRLELRRLMGLPSNAGIRLSENIHLPARIAVPAEKTLLEGLEQRRLDLVALRRGYDSREAAARAAVMQQFPRISLGPSISRDTDNIQAIGFGLNIELPIFNHRKSRIALEEATRRKLFDEYASRVALARSDVALILSGIRFTNRQISAARASESDLQRLVASYRTALAEGRTDALVYYAAANELTSAQEKVFALEGTLARASVALELATGFYEIPQPALAQAARPEP